MNSSEAGATAAPTDRESAGATSAPADRESAAALSERARTLVNSEFRSLVEKRGTRASSVQCAGAAAEAGAGAAVEAGAAPLVGVVALVEVGAAGAAAGLRAALRALGASVRARWAADVTHVVWAAGGRAAVRRSAVRLNADVVCSEWVWRCAAESRRAPEQEYRAHRPSDPPSPRRMRSLLRWAEKENVPLDTSAEGPAQAPPTSEAPLRRRRPLYTARADCTDGDSSPETRGAASVPAPRRRCRAGPVIVCTGVPSGVRAEAQAAVAALGGAVEARVSRRTTHLVCGARRTLAALEGAARGCRPLDARWLGASRAAGRWLPAHHYALPALCRAHAAAHALREAGGGGGGPLLDVFAGLRVHVSARARHARGAMRLLRLCGATVTSAEDAALLVTDSAAEAAAGAAPEAVTSRWVFDSVCADRPRPRSRYHPRDILPDGSRS